MKFIIDMLTKIMAAIFGTSSSEEEPKPIVASVSRIPVKGDISNDVLTVQKALNRLGFNITEDEDFGPQTQMALGSLQLRNGLNGSGIIGPKTLKLLGLTLEDSKPTPVPTGKSNAPWFWKLKKYSGQKETNPKFNKEMSAKWTLVGLDLKTIAKNWAAWCGLFVAVGLAGTGYQWQKTGATAKNWDKYGQKIEWRVNGFPQGAIIRINHKGKCSNASSNHVTLANGFCSAKDLLKANATFSGYGGNQGNTAKVSTFKVRTICSVSWPKEKDGVAIPLPSRVLKSVNCSNGKTSNESTVQLKTEYLFKKAG